MQINKSFSNLLIYLSIFFTVFLFFNPELLLFGINRNFLENGKFYLIFLQFFIGMFLHGGITHLLFNSIFIYYFGNIVELLIGKKKFIIFYLFCVFFIGGLLIYTTQDNTIGISGFAMALLSYYTLELKSKNNPEYKGGITALILNLGIGFLPGISLYGHFYGAIAGIIFYFLNKKLFKEKLVGIIYKSPKKIELNNI